MRFAARTRASPRGARFPRSVGGWAFATIPGMTGKNVIARGVLALILAGCGNKDNSADTDKASEQLRAAQTAVESKRNAVSSEADELERRRRELAQAQQDLKDRESALQAETGQLGSAAGVVATAQVAYQAAVGERLAKLDAALATLATRTNAAAKDAGIGLVARRKQLADKLATLASTPETYWATYTRDVDTTFDAIERDLQAALK